MTHVQTGGNDYTVMTSNLNVRMSLVTDTKLSTTPLLLTMGEELGVTQHSHSLAVVDESNGS